LQPEHSSIVSTSLNTVVEKILGVLIIKSTPISEGANNQVYDIETKSGRFILKHYPATPSDQRDRFHAETKALQFLNDVRLPCIPRLVGNDPDRRVAIMEYVEGKTLDAIASHHIQAAIDFTLSLHDASKDKNACEIGTASEACLSPIEVSNQIAVRRSKLESSIAKHKDLGCFLEQKFDPVFVTFHNAAIEKLEVSGINAQTNLVNDQLTLSPSDFGFHNALDMKDKVIFLDFEYFGWDDPVRLVSDFLLHPGHNLSVAQKELFARVTSEYFSNNDKSFLPRLEALYPLIGLRWCMILLNEFLPERLARRRAAGARDDAKAIYARQLGKSETLLTTLLETKRVLPL